MNRESSYNPPSNFVQTMKNSRGYQDTQPPLPHGYNTGIATSQIIDHALPPPPRVDQVITYIPQQNEPDPYIPTYRPPPQNKQERIEKVIDWIIYFLPFIFALIVVFITANIFYCRITQTSEVKNADKVLQNLVNNLVQAPILEIQNAEQQQTSTFRHFRQRHSQTICPPGFEQATLGVWPGVQSGCICDDGSVQSSVYCLTHSACQKVSEKSPFDYKLWKNQPYCVKRATNWKWVGTTQDCEDGFQKCSGNICVSAELTCPITNIVKVSATPTGGTQNQNNQNNAGKKMKIGNDNYSFKNDQGQPLIGFSLTPGGTATNAPCFENDQSPSFQSGQFYPLQNQPAKGCDSYGMEENYVLTLDNDLVSKVYEYNLFSTSLANIPLYSRYITESDTFLFQGIKRMQLGSNKECNVLSANEVNQIKDKAYILNGYTKFICILCIVLSILIIIFLPLLFIFRKKVN